MTMFSSLVFTYFGFHHVYIPSNNKLFKGGGWDYGWDGENERDLVLKFDIDKEKFDEFGKMIYNRTFHALSIVQLSDYSNWCKNVTL